MKGKLINKESNWFVEYKAEQAGKNAWFNTLPLHPDELGWDGKIKTLLSQKENEEVEFEIVIKSEADQGTTGEVNIKIQYAKLITPKQEESSWDIVKDKYYVKNVKNVNEFIDWLKENYQPPVKLNK